jgi:hypothetical protein
MSAVIIGRIILLKSFLKTALFVLAAGFIDQPDINDLLKKPV